MRLLMPENRLWPVSIKGVLFTEKKVVLLLSGGGEWELPPQPKAGASAN
jgi:hypothetical protein